MSDAVALVLVAIVAQVGTWATIVLTAWKGRRKLEEVHDLVNARSDAQLQQIEAQAVLIDRLLAQLGERRRDD